MDKKERLRNRLRHNLHPLHVFCRLLKKTGEHDGSVIVAMWYERLVWTWLKKLIEFLPD